MAGHSLGAQQSFVSAGPLLLSHPSYHLHHKSSLQAATVDEMSHKFHPISATALVLQVLCTASLQRM